jgi:O-antigen/teichoic acid export membrane protein
MATGQILYKSMYWKILQLVLSFFINLFLARHFQSSISAEFYSFVYLLSLFASFFTLGLDIGLNYYLSRLQLSARAACKIIAVVTAVALLISLPLLTFLFRPGRYPDLSIRQWIFFSGCHIAGVLLTSLSGTLFTAYGRNYLPARYSFAINLVLAAGVFSVPFFYQGHQLVENLFFLYFSFSFLQGMVLYVMAAIRWAGKAGASPDQKIGVRDILRYSFTAFIINFIFFLGGRLCIYLLPYRVGAADQGNYIQAYKLVEYMGLIASFLYYPFIALVAGQAEGKTKDRLLLFLVRLSNTAVLVFSIFMLVAGKTLLPFVYGHSFERMYGIFVCFIPGLFPVCSSTFFTAYYYGTGQLKYNFISGCIQLTTIFILFFVCTSLWGVQGAAVAFSLGSIASMAYDCIVFRKVTPYRVQDLLLTNGADWRLVLDFVRQWRRQPAK